MIEIIILFLTVFHLTQNCMIFISSPFTRCPESVRMCKEASPKVLPSKLLGGVDQVC